MGTTNPQDKVSTSCDKLGIFNKYFTINIGLRMSIVNKLGV